MAVYQDDREVFRNPDLGLFRKVHRAARSDVTYTIKTISIYFLCAFGIVICSGCSNSQVRRVESKPLGSVTELVGAVKSGDPESKILDRLRLSPIIHQRLSDDDVLAIAAVASPNVLATLGRCTGATQFSTQLLASFLSRDDISTPQKISSLSVVDLSYVDLTDSKLSAVLRQQPAMLLGVLSGWGLVEPSLIPQRPLTRIPPEFKLKLISDPDYKLPIVMEIQAGPFCNVHNCTSTWRVSSQVQQNFHVHGLHSKSGPLKPTLTSVSFYIPPDMTSRQLVSIGAPEDGDGRHSDRIVASLLVESLSNSQYRILDYLGGGYCERDGTLVPYGATNVYTLESGNEYILQMRYHYVGVLVDSGPFTDIFTDVLDSNTLRILPP